MEKTLKNKTELKEILAANESLREGVKHWSVSYNKTADMVVAGKDFPVGSFYFPVDDGVMLRIDKDKKIYGFAIENAKYFIKEHPEFTFLFDKPMRPVRYYLFTLPMFFVFFQIASGIFKMRSLLSFSDYIAAKAAYC